MEEEVVEKQHQKDKQLRIEHWKSPTGKTYRIPVHELFGCGKYFETKYPKEQARHKQRKFFTLEECKQMQGKLTCGIKLKPPVQAPINKQTPKVPPKQAEEPIQQVKVEKVQRPPLAKQGNTHFIYIPLAKQLADLYNNALQPVIKEQMLPLEYMHATLMKFKLKSDDDLNTWANLIKDPKKRKITIKGLSMLGQKDRYARQLFLNVQGLDDLCDTIMGKAMTQQLLTEADNSGRMKFDKGTQTYKLLRPHITILRTSGRDLVDSADYLKTFKDVVGPAFTLSELRIGVIDSFRPGKGFYDERIIKL